MSSGGFHVHGPHDHELEHAAQGEHGQTAHHGIGGGSLTNQIAMCTAVIATVGAIFAYMGGATQANAGLYKNDAAIKKTEAANQWAFFQAKSTKQSLSEFARDLATTEDRRAAYQAKVERYEKEKDDIKRDADRLEAEARQWDEVRDADAPASPLGAGHHRAAGRHCPCSHRAADQEEMAGIRHARRGSAGPWRGRAGHAAHLERVAKPQSRISALEGSCETAPDSPALPAAQSSLGRG
jgi:hypothetical protein